MPGRAVRAAIPTTVWPAVRPGCGEARTTVGRVLAAFPDRASNAIVLTAAHAAAYAHTAADRTSMSITNPAHRPPTTATAAPPARAVAPFWAAMIESDQHATQPSPAASSETAALTSQGPRRESRREPQPGLWRWDLVVIEQGCQLAGDGLGMLAAARLAAGGVLAVLTHSERRGGRLLDPTGSVVASAQAADLLYLQHIVLLTTPLHAPVRAPLTAAASSAAGQPAAPFEQATGGGGGGGVSGTGGDPAAAESASAATSLITACVEGEGVIDLLLFVQPSDPGQDSAPPDTTTVRRLIAPSPDGPAGFPAASLEDGDRA